MKRSLFSCTLLAISIIASAQFSPENYSTVHSDSCWHFTLGYNTPKMPSNDGMLVVTHLCTPDTCISSTTRHLQGKRYAKRYIKRYGNRPELHEEGEHSCMLTVPETVISDTVYAITYSEYDNGARVEYLCDTVAIHMPECPPMSCHRVQPQPGSADYIAIENPHVHSMRHYYPLTASNADGMAVTPSIVRYVTGSSKLDPEYLDNAKNIEELMGIIDDVLADSSTHLEAVQIVGYTSPDGGSNRATLGQGRATAMRDHIRRHHNLPDSIFEVADGGTNWNMLYSNIRSIDNVNSDSLITAMKRETDSMKRESILKRYKGGTLYRELTEKMFPNHRMACCTGIYYSRMTDSTTMTLNRIVDELINNPHPDYGRLVAELKQYKNDPRVLNLQGVIDYRRHHRHAAEQAFAKAAAMGDKQAAVNLQIVENNKSKEEGSTF